MQPNEFMTPQEIRMFKDIYHVSLMYTASLYDPALTQEQREAKVQADPQIDELCTQLKMILGHAMYRHLAIHGLDDPQQWKETK